MTLLDQIKNLYDAQMYEDVKTLGSMILTVSEHNPELLPLPSKYQLMVYYGDAIYQAGEYKKAECTYRKAVQMKKVINKSKGKVQPADIVAEVEVKYKLHLCYCKLKQFRDAISALDGISWKQRSSKINMALAKLHQKFGNDRSAVTAYKEVLRENPLSLEAAKGLLSLGLKGVDVASLVMAAPNMGNMEAWLMSWNRGQAFAAARDYTSATQAFKSLDIKPLLQDNISLLCSLGEVQFLNGDYNGAMVTLQRARAVDPFLLDKMDVLAFLYEKENKAKELENLATQLMAVTESAPEPWVAMGYYCLSSTKTRSRAIYFAQRACTLDSTVDSCLEALLLKGAALLSLKRVEDSIIHFREALRFAPYRYEAHKGLVDCYLVMDRVREAVTLASQAYKQLGTNARSLTLYASVLAKEPLNLEKAKVYLEKAMKMDPNYLEAVHIMTEILAQQQQFDKGIQLLRKVLQNHSTNWLHTKLAEFLTHNNEHQEALDQFSIALFMNPTDKRARNGMERVEKQEEIGLNNTYDLDVEDVEGSDNEVDPDGSDLEGAWPDIDFSRL